MPTSIAFLRIRDRPVLLTANQGVWKQERLRVSDLNDTQINLAQWPTFPTFDALRDNVTGLGRMFIDPFCGLVRGGGTGEGEGG